MVAGAQGVPTSSILSILPVPQQLPISASGSTFMNTGTVPVILSTDSNVTSANSFQIVPNGVIPLPVGPMWASVIGSVSGTLVAIAGLYNVSNPNVNIEAATVTISGPVVVSNIESGNVAVTGTVDIGGGTVDIGSISGPVDITGGPIDITSVTDLVTTGGELDYLGSFNPTLGAAGVFAGNVTALNSYTAIVVVAAITTGVPPVCVLASDGTLSAGGTVRVPTFSGSFIIQPSNANYQSILGMSCKAGDNLDLLVRYQAACTGVVYVFGSTSLQPKIRADGRSNPIGSQAVNASIATGSGTVIAAPGASIHILLKTLNHVSNNVNSSVIGTINGVAVDLSNCFGGSFPQQVAIPEDGLLLDANTALTMGAGAGIQAANATYDIVF